MRTTVIIGCFLLGLTACQEPIKTAADIRGACDAFDAPVQPVLGKRSIDQRWIDKAVEAGVSACGWSRPRAVENVNRAVAAAR